MKLNKEEQRKLKRFIERESAHVGEIVGHNDGTIVFAGGYTARAEPEGWTANSPHLSATLLNPSAATAWVTAHRAGRLDIAAQIVYYSERITLNQDQLARYSAMLTHTSLTAAKMSEVVHRISQDRAELTKYITIAKYWQLRGFYNETARSRTTKYSKKQSQNR